VSLGRGVYWDGREEQVELEKRLSEREIDQKRGERERERATEVGVVSESKSTWGGAL
jgi:hypothetical protein